MRLRFAVVFVVFAILTTSCAIWPEKKHPGWHHASGGEQLEQLFWQAVQRKDLASLEPHVASTFTAVMNGRTLDRDATFEQLKTVEMKSFTLSELKVIPNGDTMTVAYLFTPDTGSPARMMTVWQQQKSGWVAIAHAESSAAAAR